jgi:hypothetical protein
LQTRYAAGRNAPEPSGTLSGALVEQVATDPDTAQYTPRRSECSVKQVYEQRIDTEQEIDQYQSGKG